MSLEENKVIVVRYFEEVVNGGNLDLIDELFAANYVYHNSDTRGAAGKRESQAWLRGHLSDLHAAIEQVIGEEDTVVVQYLYSFTHSSPVFGAHATGRRVDTRSIDIFRLTNGQIIDQWSNEDWYGVFQQIGVAPSES